MVDVGSKRTAPGGVRCLALAAALAFLAAEPAAADFLTYTGSTVGGPTWNRPVANGNLPPVSPLSGVGTAVPYQAQTFTVAMGGVYDFLSEATDPAGWDNYSFLYQGAFDPANPLVNAVIGNDDLGAIGLSGFQSVALTAGQSYVFVTTGFENTDEGAFQNQIAQQFVFQTGDTTGGPTWDPFAAGEAIPYSVFEFTVSASGRYGFQSTAGFDNIAVLYQDAFDPTSPDTNLVNFNDDNPDIGLAGFLGDELEAGRTYFFVTSGFDESSFGEFTNRYSGPGELRVRAVPEPSSIALLGIAGLMGLGCARRRKRDAMA